jgi:hypothetical protein
VYALAAAPPKNQRLKIAVGRTHAYPVTRRIRHVGLLQWRRERCPVGRRDVFTECHGHHEPATSPAHAHHPLPLTRRSTARWPPAFAELPLDRSLPSSCSSHRLTLMPPGLVAEQAAVRPHRLLAPHQDLAHQLRVAPLPLGALLATPRRCALACSYISVIFFFLCLRREMFSPTSYNSLF